VHTAGKRGGARARGQVRACGDRGQRLAPRVPDRALFHCVQGFDTIRRSLSSGVEGWALQRRLQLGNGWPEGERKLHRFLI